MKYLGVTISFISIIIALLVLDRFDWALAVGYIVYSVYLIVTRIRLRNNARLKQLFWNISQLNDYDYFNELEKIVTSEDLPNITQSETKRIKYFFCVILEDETSFPIFRYKFESISKSDAFFYQYALLMCYYYLINDEIESFVRTYKFYSETVVRRTEKSILNEELGVFQINKFKIELPESLIDMLYQHYAKGDDILKHLLQYKVKNRFDEMFYICTLYNYLTSTENHKLRSDIEHTYNEYVEVRERLIGMDKVF